MTDTSNDFSLNIKGIKGLCPPGEAWAKQHMQDGKFPILSCEGPCVRGDIARLVANIISEDPRFARCCYQEAFNVPHSAMAEWVKEKTDKIVMIDGCFLTCVGRMLENLVSKDKIIHFDILPMYNKYQDLFAMEDVPINERQAVAQSIADKLLPMLNERLAEQTSAA